jgi:hypothetical protein
VIEADDELLLGIEGLTKEKIDEIREMMKRDLDEAEVDDEEDDDDEEDEEEEQEEVAKDEGVKEEEKQEGSANAQEAVDTQHTTPTEEAPAGKADKQD